MARRRWTYSHYQDAAASAVVHHHRQIHSDTISLSRQIWQLFLVIFLQLEASVTLHCWGLAYGQPQPASSEASWVSMRICSSFWWRRRAWFNSSCCSRREAGTRSWWFSACPPCWYLQWYWRHEAVQHLHCFVPADLQSVLLCDFSSRDWPNLDRSYETWHSQHRQTTALVLLVALPLLASRPLSCSMLQSWR